MTFYDMQESVTLVVMGWGLQDHPRKGVNQHLFRLVHIMVIRRVGWPILHSPRHETFLAFLISSTVQKIVGTAFLGALPELALSGGKS